MKSTPIQTTRAPDRLIAATKNGHHLLIPLSRTVLRNIASNWVGYCVQVVVAFALTPYILHSLGETRYGIWTLAVGLTGYYGLLDLGFSSGITQYLTRYLAAKDNDSLNRTASTGVLALSCCGLLVFIACITIAINASLLFHVAPELTQEVALVIVITGASVAIQFAFFTYSAVFTAVQRFDLANGIGVATRIISALAIVSSLKSGYGLVGLSLALAGTNLIDYLIRWRVATRLLPSMKISIKMASRHQFGEIMKFGFWSFTIAGSVRLISYTDSLVIVAFMPVSAVAPFALAASMRSYFEEIFMRAGYVFFPPAMKFNAAGNWEGLRSLYLVSSKFMFLGSLWCGTMAIFWARDFFRLWLGEAYGVHSGYPSIAAIFYLLILGSIVSVAQRVGYQILLGTHQVSLLAGLFAIEGVSNLLLSIILVRSYGLIGVALGTLLPALVFQGIFQPFFVCRPLKISLSAYFREVLLRPIIAAIALGPLLAISVTVVPRVGDWGTLMLYASLGAVVTVAVVLAVGLNKSERQLLLLRPVARYWGVSVPE